MLAPYRWIKDYVDFTESVEELADKMVMTGNGVENIVRTGDNVTNVVVGKIIKIEKHPDADKLQICQVDIGRDEPVQIVTAATNVFEGAVVPASLVGAKLANGLEIKKGKLRGVESLGMFCSGEELGITEDEYPGSGVNGIYILDENAEIGQDIRTYLGLDASIIEFEIGANRPDCLSILGIAKEAAAATGAEYRDPDISFAAKGGDISDIVSVEVKDPDLCSRYMAGAVKNIKIADSPDWMKKRLREAGVRPINNIVDITNFVMIETGQPMHAFDAQDIAGSSIVVRRAAKGENITTLDDKERQLTESMLMICDGSKPIGIAGIMGGQNSEIKDTTKTIVFESACFMYGNIRQTSRALGLATESSMRFSKGVAPQLCEFALMRALHLIEELGCGEIVGGIIDINNADLSEKTVKVTPEYINGRLGTDIPAEDMVEYLNRVFIRTTVTGEGLECVIPALRTDIYGKADISEEVARMFGYDNISATLLPAGLGGIVSENEKTKDMIRGYLTDAGFYECITYSFAGEQDYRKLGIEKPESIELRNPLGDDTALLRTTLVADMLTVVSNNIAKKNTQLRLYEIGKHYFPNKNPEINAPVDEHPVLIMSCAGEGEDFFTLKGECENIISILSGKAVRCVRAAAAYMHPGRCAEIMIGESKAGLIGEISEDVRANFDISKPVYVAELYLDTITANADTGIVRYKTLPRFPASERDMAVVVDDETGAGDVLDIIKRAGGKKLESAELFDVYKGINLGPGKKSLAYKLVFRAEDRTLTDEETEAAFAKILRVLGNECGAQLR